MKKIYKGNVIFTPTPEAFEILEHGSIVVDECGKIEGVFAGDIPTETYGVLPEKYSGCETIDYGDKLLMPAMYDLHVHAPQYRNMGMAMDMELLPWLEKYTFPEEIKYANADYASVMYHHFVSDMRRCGTMRAAVFASIHPEATKILAHEFESQGMGALIGLVGMDRNCPSELTNSPEEAVRSTIELIRETEKMQNIGAIVTPRFVPSCTPDMLTALGRIALEYGLPVQSHLSENRSEIEWVRELEPESSCYGDAYYRYGLFGQTPTLMAHCCYTEGEELELMARMGVVAVHCPTSNCNLGSGIAPVRSFLDMGIRVALGSDIAGGHELSMFGVMRYAQQMSKLMYARSDGRMPFLTLSEVFHMATKSGGAFFGKVGSFEAGYEFDALVVDDSPLNEANRTAACKEYSIVQRLERFVYLGNESMICARFCAGK